MAYLGGVLERFVPPKIMDVVDRLTIFPIIMPHRGLFFIVLKHEAQFVHGELLSHKNIDCCVVRLHGITQHKYSTQYNLTATPWILSLHLSRIAGLLPTSNAILHSETLWFNLHRHSVVPSGCSFHHNRIHTLDRRDWV